MKIEMWVIYPTDPTKGFCPSYCKTEESAWKEKMAAERLTGIKWTEPQNHEVTNHLTNRAMTDKEKLIDELDFIESEIDGLLECIETMKGFGLNTDEAMRKVAEMIDEWCDLTDYIDS